MAEVWKKKVIELDNAGRRIIKHFQKFTFHGDKKRRLRNFKCIFKNLVSAEVRSTVSGTLKAFSEIYFPRR
jgi:hypothetical protein